MPSRPLLTFKHEDATPEGEPLGPVFLTDRKHGTVDQGWMTLSEARKLARERGYDFSED